MNIKRFMSIFGICLLLILTPFFLITCSLPYPWYKQRYEVMQYSPIINNISAYTSIYSANRKGYMERGPFKFSMIFAQPEKKDVGREIIVHSAKIYGNKKVFYDNENLSLHYTFADKNYKNKTENGAYHYSQNGFISFSVDTKMNTKFYNGQILTSKVIYSVKYKNKTKKAQAITKHKAKTIRGFWRYYGP